MRNVYLVTGALLLLVALMYCYRDKRPAYHSFLSSGTYQSKSRQEQVQQCQSCHAAVFENESKGAHAQAFTYLKQHVAYVNGPVYDCAFYTDHVNEAYWMCKSCHAPKNLYETFLFDSLQNPKATLAKLMSIRNPRPAARADAELSTGIDCMSCHVKGNEIVSHKTVFTAQDSFVQHQTPEVVTSNNLLCFSCHAEVVRSINPTIAIQRTGVVRCVKCHQEYDAQGKGTHYYFWQHEAPGKSNPKVDKILHDFTYAYSAASKAVHIVWTNTTIPHQISSGPEMVWIYRVLSQQGSVLTTDTFRVNKKKEFDIVMYRNMNNNYHRGVQGIDVPLDGSPHHISIPLPKGQQPAAVQVVFMHKSQYWFPDSLASVLATKNYPL